MVKISEDVKNLAIMAHDLKAPLSAVVNLLTIIEKGYVDDPEKVKDLISRARKKTETTIKIVDDIFIFDPCTPSFSWCIEIPISGSGARSAVFTDDNVTIGSREVENYWDLVSDRSVSDGQTLTLQDCELRINEA